MTVKDVPFAIKQHRLNPNRLDYSSLKKFDLAEIQQQKENMEFMDNQTLSLKLYLITNHRLIHQNS